MLWVGVPGRTEQGRKAPKGVQYYISKHMKQSNIKHTIRPRHMGTVVTGLTTFFFWRLGPCPLRKSVGHTSAWKNGAQNIFAYIASSGSFFCRELLLCFVG